MASTETGANLTATTELQPPHTEYNNPSVVEGPFEWTAGRSPAPLSVDDEEDAFEQRPAAGESSAVSSTTPVTSSFHEHIEENGRTYQSYKQGKYMLPNDKPEQDRLYLQHVLFKKSVNGRLALAPIGKPQHVLDIGTGTGIWAIEFAQQHPNSNVLGTDLCSIQPLHFPPNCHFEIHDAEDEWTFSEPFDYVHGRALASCFSSPKPVIQKAFNSLTPGGWFELQDGVFPPKYLGTPPTDSALYRWGELIVEASTKLGRPWTNVQFYAHWMREVGFEDVTEKKAYWPLNAWAKGRNNKELAELFQEDLLMGLEGLSLKVIGSLGWTKEQILELLPGVRENIKDKRVHAYVSISVVYGRKPLSAS